MTEGQPLLHGRRILVAKDDYILAEDLRRELVALGATVAGPVWDVAGALRRLAADLAIGSAILDIQPGRQMVYPVADALRARALPFIFVTGYGGPGRPPAYAGVPRARKTGDLMQMVRALLDM